MEFFKIIDVKTEEKEIQTKIKLSTINKFVSDIFVLDEASESSAYIGSKWGEFTLKYDIIKGGIRFYLVECPNALVWTITTGYPPEEDKIVFHLTINRTQKDPEFIDEIKDFVEDWESGIINNF